MRRVPWWGWSLAGIAVVIAIVAGIGGFAETPVTKVPTIALGDVYEGRQIDWSVESIELMSDVPGAVLPDDDSGQFAVATVLLTNHDDAPAPLSTAQLMLLIEDIDYVELADQQVTSRELGLSSLLQPGVPTEMLYIWAVPATVSADDAAIIGLLEAVPDPDSLYGDGELGEPLAVRRIEVTFDREAPRAGDAS